ncbi:hypothetical protein TREES_T100009778 [Tupaia chinensis]|uniref:Uncharacterized protein n=1 Tax=Tupaia chinensis TaxID=246437 RepID=L9KQI6_TUPCH|nr:hypothetical protein TREES_T100009778 [Tupaia chinensis]
MNIFEEKNVTCKRVRLMLAGVSVRTAHGLCSISRPALQWISTVCTNNNCSSFLSCKYLLQTSPVMEPTGLPPGSGRVVHTDPCKPG